MSNYHAWAQNILKVKQDYLDLLEQRKDTHLVGYGAAAKGNTFLNFVNKPLDFIIDESLVEEEQTYLMNTLEADPQLSVIFDKVIETASEFSGAGEVIGPGTGVSDSIPARLSDGEFVMTRKATDAIGPDNLQMLMDDAEMAYDYDGGRELQMAFGGVVEGDEDDIEDTRDSLSQTDEEIRKVMIGSNRMPSVR